MVMAFHAQAAHAATQVLTALEQAGVAAVPVKGVLLARTLYPHPSQRPISDVDLRVRARDLPAVLTVARARGWKIEHTSQIYRDATLAIDDVGFDVEAWIGAPFMSSLTVEQVLSRATQQREPLGCLHWHPELHDHVLQLVLNVYKDHVVEATPWAVHDLERVVALPAFDARVLAARARQAGNGTLLWTLARWLDETRGCVGWRAVHRAVGAPSRPRYAARMLALWAAPEGTSRLQRRLLVRAASDDPRYRAAAIATMAAWALVHRGRWAEVTEG
jgi:hypothetical protein